MIAENQPPDDDKKPVPKTGGSGPEPDASGKMDQGGSGGVEESLVATGNRDYVTARDVRLIGRLARRKDWDVPDVALERLPKEMTLIALGKHPSHQDKKEHPEDLSARTKISAARTVAVFYGQNQANDPRPQRHEHEHVHVEVEVDELIKLMETEVEARGLAVDEPGNGDADSAPPPD